MVTEMLLGASTIAFREQPLGRDVLTAMRDAGVESVELTDYHPEFQYHDLKPFETIRDLLEELGLHLNSLHIHPAYWDKKDPYPGERLFGHIEVEDDVMDSAYRSAIDVMEVLGGGILVTHDIPLYGDRRGGVRVMSPIIDTMRPPNWDPDEPMFVGSEGVGAAADKMHWESFVRDVQALAQYATSKGVSVALENTPSRHFVGDPIASRSPHSVVRSAFPFELKDLVMQVGESNVGIVLDTGHRNLIGDVAAAVRLFADHLISLHIHDNGGAADEHLLPGRGVIDWNECVQALRDVKYGGVFMYELQRPEDLAEIRGNFETLM